MRRLNIRFLFTRFISEVMLLLTNLLSVLQTRQTLTQPQQNQQETKMLPSCSYEREASVTQTDSPQLIKSCRIISDQLLFVAPSDFWTFILDSSHWWCPCAHTRSVPHLWSVTGPREKPNPHEGFNISVNLLTSSVKRSVSCSVSVFVLWSQTRRNSDACLLVLLLFLAPEAECDLNHQSSLLYLFLISEHVLHRSCNLFYVSLI